MPKSNKHDKHEVYRSAIGSNFTVQTEDEKLAAKLARKERKKHGNRDEGELTFDCCGGTISERSKEMPLTMIKSFDTASFLEDEAAISSAMLGFDQEDLRKAREEQLRNNASMPLASSQQVHTVKNGLACSTVYATRC